MMKEICKCNRKHGIEFDHDDVPYCVYCHGTISPKIYIAGKVTGEPIAACTMKFGAMQKQLESLGFEVVNPLEVVGSFDTPWKEAMQKCITALIQCDAIYLLEDFINSRGALLEREIALGMDIPRFLSIDKIKKHYGATHHLHS